MKISVVTPNWNGERFLEETVQSVVAQRGLGIETEYIVVDAESTDGSHAILHRYRDAIDRLICEKDSGPASAINKGLNAASGDILCWLNADDTYTPGTLPRVAEALSNDPDKALCFGRCRIIDETGKEIRRGITRFKEAWYPFSCRPAIQAINYISQPAMFFRRSAWETAGPLREDLKAAFDYDFTLRLWRHGGACRVPGPPLAAFRWHPGTISGRHFSRQFKEEYEIAVSDAGRWSIPALVHGGVRWGIVGAYSLMAKCR